MKKEKSKNTIKVRDLFDKTDIEYHQNVLKYCLSDAFKAFLNRYLKFSKKQIEMAIKTIGMIHRDR